MKVITVANQKGGVGKTSVVFHLASYLDRIGKRCIVIDLDQQENVTTSLRKHHNIAESRFAASDLISKEIAPGTDDILPNATSNLYLCAADWSQVEIDLTRDVQELCHNLLHNIEVIKKQNPPIDYIIIDTAPSMSGRMGAALVASDYVLSPTELETFAINGLAKMLAIIENYKSVNQKLMFLGLIPNKLRHANHYETLELLKAQYSHLVIPCPLAARHSVNEAMTTGIPVWRLRKTAARVAGKEFLVLCDYIFNIMEKSNASKK